MLLVGGWALLGLTVSRSGLVACHAALIAFLVAEFFSTTMETGWVWIPALAALGGLAGLTLRGGRTVGVGVRQALGLAAAGTVGLLAILWSAGWLLQTQNPLSLRLTEGGGGKTLEARSRNPSPSPPIELTVLPDVSVMGRVYGKGLRTLMAGQNLAMRVQLNDAFVFSEARTGWVIAAGQCASSAPATGHVILLAPEIVSRDKNTRELKSRDSTLVFLPGYDEDGRAAFWEKAASRNPGSIRIVPLPGFGNDLTQAWPEIAGHLREIL